MTGYFQVVNVRIGEGQQTARGMVNSPNIFNANILIVDDLDANVHLLKRILASAGYTSVTSTMNPLEVCELHRKHRYDLILLDLLMPDMDGFQVMEKLKEIGTDIACT